jgi:hypothetical protein
MNFPKMVQNVQVLAFEPDLIFSSRIDSLARKTGIPLTLVTDFSVIVQELTGNMPRLLLLNLDALEGKLASLKDVLSGKTCVSVGYYSHMHRGFAEEAKQSGISVVISRGEFVSRFQNVLAQASCG